jgi:MoaA/NifB/PqqE/SkfB family radical SAM enzyme
MKCSPRRFEAEDYVELTMHFGCNLKCHHCMIEDTMNWLMPQSISTFETILETNKNERRWKGLTLTGAEITLDSRLAEMARQAKNNGFEHIRIQTHGMKLSDPRYTHELITAGIDEFFISVTAADAKSHDKITGVQNSFERTMAGIKLLTQYEHVSVITNTVVTQNSYMQLPAVVELLKSHESVVQIEFWNYWPMRANDDKKLIVPFLEVVPYLRAAIQLADQSGKSIEVKNFPECLLGTDAHALNNDQPQLEIDSRFWHEFMRNGFHQCSHKSSCKSKQCLGLNTAYINEYGWETEILSPILSITDHPHD